MSAIFLAFVMVCLKAATVPTSGFGAFARTAMPRGTCARFTSVPPVILLAAISSVRPSLDRITTSAGTRVRAERRLSADRSPATHPIKSSP